MIDLDKIYEKAVSEKAEYRQDAARFIGECLSKLSDKNRAWDCLHGLTVDEDDIVRIEVAQAIGSVFHYLPDSIQAYRDLQRLSMDHDESVRWITAFTFGLAFSNFPDKTQGWKDLQRLTKDPAILVRFIAIKSLGLTFAHIPDKNLAWDDLHGFTKSNNGLIRQIAAYAVGVAFEYISNKAIAWDDLQSLSWDLSAEVREQAASGIGFAFAHVSNKDQAYDNLQMLATDQDAEVRRTAAYSIGSASAYIPDRYQVGKDLHLLSRDEDKGVRAAIAYTLGSHFVHLPSRDLVFKDLQMLSQDIDERVRAVAYHALGKASVIKATEAHDMDLLRGEIISAIDYFEKSSLQDGGYNPAAFCLPFYRSLCGLIFTDISEDVEVQRYIVEAKSAVENSESKEALLNAIENLSKALLEVKSYTITDIISMKKDLKAYTRYCFQAAECLEDVKETVPFASRIVDVALVEKCLPIFDEQIKVLFREVEEAVRELCRRSKGTELESLGRSTYESSRDISEVKSPIEAERRLNDLFDMHLLSLIKARSRRLPSESQAHIDELMKIMETANLEDRLIALTSFLAADLVQGENDDRYKMILDLLSQIVFQISRLSFSTGDVKHSLGALGDDIRKLNNTMQSQGLGYQELGRILAQNDQFSVENLESIRNDLHQELDAIEDLIRELPDEEDIKGLTDKIRDLKPSWARDKISIASDITSIVAFLGISLPMIIGYLSK